jgi:nucleoid-associated protein YgaU
MGRETKILLALLATLSGVFMGVLSMKLLVPRPPAGAGADVHTEVAAARPIELVEPPALDPSTPLRSRFATPTADEIAAVDRPGVRLSTPLPRHAPDDAIDARDVEQPVTPPAAAFAAPVAPSAGSGAAGAAAPTGIAPDQIAQLAAPRRDPFVTRAAFDTGSGAMPPATMPQTMAHGAMPHGVMPNGPVPNGGMPQTEPYAEAPVADGIGRFAGESPRYAAPLPAAAAPLPPTAGGMAGQPAGQSAAQPAGYECMPGDSWWSLAERAYGDGRLYRALFAWNRTLDPRVSLAPGTRLELPPRERLEAAWPKLVPGPAVN